jgi:hypothetical protein
MKELIMQLSFKQFLKTPFSWIFIAVICALVYLGKMLIAEKDNEVQSYKERVDDCDKERQRDKKLLQDIVFQKHLNEELNGKQSPNH